MANRFFTAQYSRKTNHPRFGTSTRLQDSPFLTISGVARRLLWPDA
jgi:hypothetical protein